MTSFPTRQYLSLSGCQEHDKDQFQTKDNSTLKRKPLERFLLFDGNLAYASKYRPSSSTERLPPISEVLGESTPPQSLAGSYIETQHSAQDEPPRPTKRHRVRPIPKIIIQCEPNNNFIKSDPAAVESRSSAKFYHRATKTGSNNDNNNHDCNCNYSFLIPTLPDIDSKLTTNPKLLSLKGDYNCHHHHHRGRKYKPEFSAYLAAAATFEDVLPQLPPRKEEYRKRPSYVGGGNGDECVVNVRSQKCTLDAFVLNNYATSTASTDADSRGIKTCSGGSQKSLNLDDTTAPDGDGGGDDNRVWKHREYHVTDDDTRYWKWLTSDIGNVEVKRVKPLNRPRMSPPKMQGNNTHAQDSVIIDFNNIARAFRGVHAKDAFSPMSGNLTSDLRHHISRMSRSSGAVKAIQRHGDRGDLGHPDMHLLDVMTTKSKHRRLIREHSSPIPIAEGMDLSTLVPTGSEETSSHQRKEQDRDVLPLSGVGMDVSEEEIPQNRCQDKVEPRKNFRKTRHDLGSHWMLCIHSENDYESDSTSDESEIADGNNTKCIVPGDRDQSECHDNKAVGADSKSKQEKNCNKNQNEELDFPSVLECRTEVTTEVDDAYEYKAEIHYNVPGSTNDGSNPIGEQKQFSFASWFIPKSDLLAAPQLSTLKLQNRAPSPAKRKPYITNLSKTVTVPARKIVSSSYAQKNNMTTNLHRADSKLGHEHRTARATRINYNNWENTNISNAKSDPGSLRYKSTNYPNADRVTQRLRRQQTSTDSVAVEKDPRVISWEEAGDCLGEDASPKVSCSTLPITPIIPPSKADIKAAQKMQEMKDLRDEQKTETVEENTDTVEENTDTVEQNTDTVEQKTIGEDDKEREEEAELQFMKRIKARVTRMRRELPPPSPTKLCFFVSSNSRTHKDILNQIEACKKVKVTSLQYDPIYINSCGKGIDKSMWIFELTPESDRQFLLSRELKVFNQLVTVRALDDVYNEEHRTYLMYHDVRLEQHKKRLTRNKKRTKTKTQIN